MAKLVIAVLCAAIAVVAARQLHSTVLPTINDLPQILQDLNAR